jgi:exodeoxyribonuclease VII large subunit
MSGRRNVSKDGGGSRPPRRGRDAGGAATAAAAGPRAGAIGVSALLARIKSALAAAFPQRVCVIGEISNLNVHTSGHLYFRLKDAGGCLDAVMWRSGAARLKFTPADGLEVFAEGRVDVYEVQGRLQFYVEHLTPKGQGALELAFRQLRDKLQREGLFEASHKVPLARFPRAIGVVTSETGAAVRDIRRALARRWPAAAVYLLPTIVQGAEAAESVARAVALLDRNASRLGIDTIIVARGGGSLEDLWAFNEEPVARAIYAARTPIVTGIGHEVDVTIADLVADVRAATPTAAAEVAVPDRPEVGRHLTSLGGRLRRHVEYALGSARERMGSVLRSVVLRDPLARVRTQMQRTDELSHRLRAGLGAMLARHRRRLEPAANRLSALHPARLAERARARVDRLGERLRWALGGRSKRAGDLLTAAEVRLLAAHPRHRLRLAAQKIDAARRQLDALSYRNVLNRGFSVTRGKDGAILRSAGEVRPGDRVETELTDGRFPSVVREEPEQLPRGELDAGQAASAHVSSGRRGNKSTAPQKTRATKSASRTQKNTLFD